MAVQLVTTIQRWIGLSTDTKPAVAPVGSTFHEYDTKLTYITYDGGTNWVRHEYTLGAVNVAVNRDMPYLVEFWEGETFTPTVWDQTIDGLGSGAFGTAAGYMYYNLTTGAIADNDAFINSINRWQARPASFGDANSMLQRLVLEFEAQAVTAITSHDNTHFFMGLSSAKSNDITTQNVIGFYLASDVLKGKVDAAGSETLTGAITATLTNWNKFRITVEDTSVTFALNGTNETAIATNLPSAAMYIVFGTRAEGAAAVGLNIGCVRAWYEEVL
jgi:hypothetical protein